MKRKGKCVGKVAFSSWFDAKDVARKHYLSHRRIFSIYECPKCLDYHLTSKSRTCNLAHLHAEWDKEKTKPKDRELRNSRRIMNKQWSEFSKLFRTCCHKHGVSVRGYERTHKKKKPTVLKGVLHREERLRILAEMHSRQNPYIWGQVKKWFKAIV